MQSVAALKSEKNSYALSDVSVFSEHSVKLTAIITNQDPVSHETLIHEGFYINELGIFAKPEGEDGVENEVLYSLAVTSGNNGDIMPPFNGYHPAQIIQEYYVTVNNSAQVTIMTGTGAAALAEDFEALVDEENIEEAFYIIYTKTNGEPAITKEEIEEILNMDWDGGTTDDETALSAREVEKALDTKWDGITSDDETALSARDIENATR